MKSAKTCQLFMSVTKPRPQVRCLSNKPVYSVYRKKKITIKQK